MRISISGTKPYPALILFGDFFKVSKESSALVSCKATSVETELDRDIGIIGAIALGTGTMIAAGIFVLSGLTVNNVGATSTSMSGVTYSTVRRA